MFRSVLSKALTFLAGASQSDAPPSEIRLFKAGINETTKGEFLFDSKAAEMVMAAAKEHGVDLMIDLEHLSLDTEARHFNPDALGHFNLDVRHGELWAVNVRWNTEGTRRLSEKTQRYVSPAFMTDDDNRITEVVNIALVAMPATHNTPALVAANRRPKHMSLKDRIALLSARLSIGNGKLTKLAADAGGDAPAGKFAAAKSAADAAAQALADFEKASGGNDVDATFAAMEAAVKACDSFEQAVSAIAGGSGGEPVPDPAAASAQAEQQQQMARKEAELVSLRKELERRDHEKQVEKLAAENDERRAICASFVTAGRMKPADVWADETATTPKAMFASMSLADLRALGKSLGAAPVPGRIAPTTGSGVAPGDSDIEVSEYEAQRVKLYADKRAAEIKAAGGTPRSADEVLSRYLGHREQQLRGAKTDDQVKRLGRRVEEKHVMLSATGRLVMLATAPVKPIEEFGASSQRSLEEFRMNYNMCLAAEPKTWAEEIGDLMPSGSVNKDTYPINLAATRYRKKTAQGPGAESALNFDISVTKDEFNAGEEVELRRLIGGDFAYVMSWGRRAERMARARVFLRNELVTAILEAGESGYWGSSSELATGIDGQPFFSATHKVHPRDPSRKLRGSATWGNFQGTAKTLGSVNLTAEKVNAFQVSDPTGHEFGFEYDSLLVPSSLNEVAKNLLTVQDLILDAAATLNGVSNVMGTPTNPHKMSGMSYTRAPDLAGTDTAADWYLLSRAGIGQGLFPWVISEDAAEDLRTWDESSDFYKDSGMIKVTSHIFLAATLLFPHAIRKVSGT
jgi:phage I-like protein